MCEGSVSSLAWGGRKEGITSLNPKRQEGPRASRHTSLTIAYETKVLIPAAITFKTQDTDVCRRSLLRLLGSMLLATSSPRNGRTRKPYALEEREGSLKLAGYMDPTNIKPNMSN